MLFFAIYIRLIFILPMSTSLPLLLPVRLIPDDIHAKIFARISNHLLRGQSLVLRLGELEGKSVSLRITDVPCNIKFRFHNGLLHSIHSQDADVIITGSMKSFLELACHKQDPDTLFFTRELSIEGDTETGVHVKNLLDSLEYNWAAHFDAVLFPPLANCAKQLMHIYRRIIAK